MISLSLVFSFLKGTCEVSGCLLTHKIDPKKMPVCSFYLKGICNIDNCPYRHVNVSVNAEICKDFVRGFCAKGDQVSITKPVCDANWMEPPNSPSISGWPSH